MWGRLNGRSQSQSWSYKLATDLANNFFRALARAFLENRQLRFRIPGYSSAKTSKQISFSKLCHLIFVAFVGLRRSRNNKLKSKSQQCITQLASGERKVSKQLNCIVILFAILKSPSYYESVCDIDNITQQVRNEYEFTFPTPDEKERSLVVIF